MGKAFGLLITGVVIAAVIGGLINVLSDNAAQLEQARGVACAALAAKADKNAADAGKKARTKKSRRSKKPKEEERCPLRPRSESRNPVGHRYVFVEGPNDPEPARVYCQRSLIFYGAWRCELDE